MRLRTASQALVWEVLRLTGPRVVMVTIAGCVLSALYRRMLLPMGSAREGVAFVALLFTLLMINIMTLLSCRDDGPGVRFPRRLTLLPVATWRLALIRASTFVVLIAAMYTVVWLFVRTRLGAPWPLVGPLLLMMAGMAVATALTWTLGRVPWIMGLVGAGLVAVLFGWLRPQFAADRLWGTFGVAEGGALLAVTAAGLGLAIVGVARERADERKTLRLRWDQRSAGGGDGPRRRGAVHAQLWMEWREKGRLMPVLAVGGLLTTAALTLVTEATTPRLMTMALVYGTLVMLAGPPIIGFLHGRFDLVNQKNTALDMTRATRPLSDRRLAWTLLLAAGRSLAATWGATLTAVAVAVAVMYTWGDAGFVDQAWGQVRATLARLGTLDTILAAGGILAYGWTAMGAMASITMTGRLWVLLTFGAGPFFLLFSVAVLERIFDLSLWTQIVPFFSSALLVTLPVVALGAVMVAWRRGFLDGRQVMVCYAFVVTFGVLLAARIPAVRAVVVGGGGWDLDQTLPLLILAVSPWVVVPVALAPLALAWNRHR